MFVKMSVGNHIYSPFILTKGTIRNSQPTIASIQFNSKYIPTHTHTHKYIKRIIIHYADANLLPNNI